MKYILGIAIICVSVFGYAQKSAYKVLRNGDLLFQDLDCELCEAIEDVTTSFDKKRFSHIGLVWVKSDSVYIVEAVGKGVVATPLSEFVKRSNNQMYVGRLKPEYKHLIERSLVFAIQQIGKEYDDEFLYANGKYYCSELVYDAFKTANNDKAFFQLEPMTYKVVGTDKFSAVWENYFQKKNQEIPEGELGINPGGISRSSKLEMFHF